MKLVVLADTHIKSRTWSNTTQISGDSIEALKKIKNYTASRKLDTLLLLGDIFDTVAPKSSDVYALLELLRDSFKTVYYIRGNHDHNYPSYIQCVPPDYTNLKVIELTSEPVQLEEGVYLKGISWMPSSVQYVEEVKHAITDFFAQHPDDILYLALHLSFQHLLAFDGSWQLNIEMIKEMAGHHKLRILVGHIHTRDTTFWDVGCYVHSPGATYPLSFDKTPEPCYGSLINVKSGNISSIDCNVRKYLKLDVRDKAGITTDFIRQAARVVGHPDDYLPTYIRVITTPDTLFQIVNDDPNYIFQVIVEGEDLEEAYHLEDDSSTNMTLLDALHIALQPYNDQDIVDMADELAASDDPKATIEEWFKQWGVQRCSR